jgi:hypothetical protein
VPSRPVTSAVLRLGVSDLLTRATAAALAFHCAGPQGLAIAASVKRTPAEAGGGSGGAKMPFENLILPPLVGRELEVRLLLELWEQVKDGG